MIEDETQRVVDLSGDVCFLKYPEFPLSLDGALGSGFSLDGALGSGFLYNLVGDFLHCSLVVASY